MSETDPDAKDAPAKKWRSLLLRVGVTCLTLALWWWLADLSLNELGEALGRIPSSAFVIAFSVSVANLAVGAMRWRVLLAAFGAVRVPPFSTLLRLYFIGLFFNTFVPANVGGDVVRAHVTRGSFPGQAGAYLIVAIERVFGLAGLLLLASGVLLVAPIESLSSVRWLGGLGVLGALLAITAPALARRFSHRLPGKLADVAASLPALQRPGLLGIVLLLSLVTQSVVALTGHVFIDALSAVPITASLVLIPIALASMYLPTIAGLGAREASFVALFAMVSVPEADATAASLAVMVTQLLTAGTGGLVLMVYGAPSPSDATGEDGDNPVVS